MCGGGPCRCCVCCVFTASNSAYRGERAVRWQGWMACYNVADLRNGRCCLCAAPREGQSVAAEDGRGSPSCHLGAPRGLPGLSTLVIEQRHPGASGHASNGASLAQVGLYLALCLAVHCGERESLCPSQLTVLLNKVLLYLTCCVIDSLRAVPPMKATSISTAAFPFQTGFPVGCLQAG